MRSYPFRSMGITVIKPIFSESLRISSYNSMDSLDIPILVKNMLQNCFRLSLSALYNSHKFVNWPTQFYNCFNIKRSCWYVYVWVCLSVCLCAWMRGFCQDRIISSIKFTSARVIKTLKSIRTRNLGNRFLKIQAIIYLVDRKVNKRKKYLKFLKILPRLKIFIST